MKELNPAERSALRARAHTLHPVVSIASKGLAPSVVAEIDASLKSHELIKVRVYGADKDVREALMKEVCTLVDAAAVQHIGSILVLYRQNPPVEAPAIKAPVRNPDRTPLKKPVKKTARTADHPLSKVKSAVSGQRRKIEYGQLRNTRSKAIKRRASGIK